ncbi:glycoside hydrolase family 3 C-terminal domain-containing protein [Rathayibacter sp. Leaf296]|uniref:glycoside hydrolase family 3 C-terminal domain-containing protein n=1 Tax=Rathayibacter sp. Leaf296 TaxID=1736327 RepID=UPI0007032E50|nr:glycoside hydrolase family 3 C-terminal domain-containing protein [Rathayibacter sp. Leaf296]KQQ09684.1 hypothetical protein ASF46_00680 [Rathayibacter sp. Leaf296]
MIALAARAERARREFPDARLDVDAHHALAREVAARAIVLLKNDSGTLPLERSGRLAVVGPFATEPRLQGGGSSRVVPTRVDVPVEELRALAPEALTETAQGYRHDGRDGERLRAEAARAAAESDAAVVFIGLTAEDEAEGTDRLHIDLPAEQVELLRAVAAAQPRTVAVVVHGGVVRLHEVAALVPAVLDATILGQAGGGAVADVLVGAAEPSGRLAETVPLRLEDSPSFLTYPGDQLHVRYGEGLFVGYRGHDRLGQDVAFPFGFGLSYTSFRYDSLQVVATGDGLEVEVVLTNTGRRDGREVVQIYVSKSGGVQRAPRELRGFSSVSVRVRDSATVRIDVPRSELVHWDLGHEGWIVEGGEWSVHAAASSRDVRLTSIVEIRGDEIVAPLTEDSTLGELLQTPEGAQQLGSLFQQVQAERAGDASDALGIDANASGMRIPLGRIRSLSAGQHLPRPELTALLARVNAARAQKAEQR